MIALGPLRSRRFPQTKGCTQSELFHTVDIGVDTSGHLYTIASLFTIVVIGWH